MNEQPFRGNPPASQGKRQNGSPEPTRTQLPKSTPSPLRGGIKGGGVD